MFVHRTGPVQKLEDNNGVIFTVTFSFTASFIRETSVKETVTTAQREAYIKKIKIKEMKR